MKRNEFMDFLCWVFYKDASDTGPIIFFVFCMILPLTSFIIGLFKPIAFLGILISVLIGAICLFGMYKVRRYYFEEFKEKDQW